jgi:hypothetical protein
MIDILASDAINKISMKPYTAAKPSLVDFDNFSDDAFVLISTFSIADDGPTGINGIVHYWFAGQWCEVWKFVC